jgi:hypothetical protein|tara:strand:- start:1413 stop:2525 length:1113 start_codon:yes stop_codon:yes gene_type:complete
MKISPLNKLQLKSGVSLYKSESGEHYLIGTLRQRVTISSPDAPAIYAALKRGSTRVELASAISINPHKLDAVIAELHLHELLETESSAIKLSQRFISKIAERAAKSGDQSKDASFSRIKNRVDPELTTARWLPGVFDSGVSKVSARQNAHIEISGNSRAAQHLFAILVASGVINTQFAPTFRRGKELVGDLDISGGFITATDIGQVFTLLSNEEAKAVALFPQTINESATELPTNFSEKVIKIHFGVIDSAISALWMASGQEHIQINEISGGLIWVSPLVQPGIGPCNRCCLLTVAEQIGATELEGGNTADELPVVGAHFLAATLAGALLQIIDSSHSRLMTHGLLIDLLDLCNTKHIAIDRHPKCGCGW